MGKNTTFSLEDLREKCLQAGLLCYVSKEHGGENECDAPLVALYGYMLQLMKWGKVMNLIGPYPWEDVLSRLVADSMYLYRFIQSLQSKNVLRTEPEAWDLGAGAGLPGIPLRTLWQEGTYTLVEVREKRALFMQTVLASLQLKNTHVFQGRAESFMPTREKSDLITSRAFMPWEKVLGLVYPYVKQGGLVIFLTLKPLEQKDMCSHCLDNQWSGVDFVEYSVQQDRRFLCAIRKK